MKEKVLSNQMNQVTRIDRTLSTLVTTTTKRLDPLTILQTKRIRQTQTPHLPEMCPETLSLLMQMIIRELFKPQLQRIPPAYIQDEGKRNLCLQAR